MRFLLVLVLAILPGIAQAQSGRPADPISDEEVRRALSLGVENFQRLKCDGNRFCPPATPEERASPPLSLAEARAIMQRGVLSGLAEHCGLDWQRRNFAPMMDYWRASMKKSERQMALVGFLHGVMQQALHSSLAARGTCGDRLRTLIESSLTFRG